MNAPIAHPLAATSQIDPAAIDEKEMLADCPQGDCAAPQPHEGDVAGAATMAAATADDTTANVDQAKLDTDATVADDKTDAKPNDTDPAGEFQHLMHEVIITEEDDMPSYEPPAHLEALLSDMKGYLFPEEEIADFQNLHQQIEEHFVTKNYAEYCIVFDATCLTWEVMRYRRMKVGIELNARHAAAKTMLGRIYDGKTLTHSVFNYFSDLETQAHACKDLEEAGFSPDAVEVEAFQRSLSSIAAVEKLIASAQKRLAVFFKDLEKRYADRAVRVQRAAEQALMESEEGDEE